jgi:hypothetical protein
MTAHRMNLHPWDAVIENVRNKLAESPGAMFFQQYNCSGCGSKLTMDEANKFYTHGSCDRCPTITDIRKDGCNFMIVLGGPLPGIKPPERPGLTIADCSRHVS